MASFLLWIEDVNCMTASAQLSHSSSKKVRSSPELLTRHYQIQRPWLYTTRLHVSLEYRTLGTHVGCWKHMLIRWNRKSHSPLLSYFMDQGFRNSSPWHLEFALLYYVEVRESVTGEMMRYIAIAMVKNSSTHGFFNKSIEKETVNIIRPNLLVLFRPLLVSGPIVNER